MKIYRYLIAAIPLCFALNIYATTLSEEDVEKEAKALFNEGKKLFREEKYTEAANAFREANRLKYSWKLLYNIAQADVAAKRYGLALEAFERYLVDGGDNIDRERQQEVLQEIERLNGMVGFLSMESADGSIVKIDEVERGTLPLPGKIRISAGVLHHLIVVQGDEVLIDRTIQVGSGQSFAVEVDLPGDYVDETSNEKASLGHSQTDNKLRSIGWSLLGVGAATAIAGVITGAASLSKEGELNEACQDYVCSEDERGIYDSANNLATTSNILIPVGAAVAATGLVLVIVGYKDENDKPKKTVELSTTPFGLSFRGSF